MHPLGFKIDEKSIKRAGLDYWDKLDIEEHSSLDEFLNKYNPENNNMFFATTKGKHVYSQVSYEPDCYLMFGPESRGIPEEILVRCPESCVRIPMWGDIRSLNLSNSVAVLLYEALRQNGFEKMTMEGQLHHLHWRDSPEKQ